MLKLQQCQIARQIPIYLIAFLKPKIGISIILIAVTYLGNEGVTTYKRKSIFGIMSLVVIHNSKIGSKKLINLSGSKRKVAYQNHTHNTKNRGLFSMNIESIHLE